MRFGILAAVIFSSVVFAVPIAEKRHAALIESREDAPVPTGAAAFGEALGTIGDNLKTTNETLNEYSGGLKGIGQLLKIQSATSDLGDAISNATAVAKATGQLSLADSATVGQQFLQLQPQINSLLDNIMSKRAEFQNAGFGLIDVISLLRSNLEEQKQESKELGDATIAILDPSLTSVATPINEEIQTKFDDAIAAYQGRGGLITIPPGLIGLLGDGDGN
ncbi:antigenic cell wall galactomannoprotein [Diplodia corticola]|uniref:Antigenic cell wall galactomannoprotein n=1 Tax=Diplodia corticola TaxID=236234 RepID=A0A1J9RRS3_9PEZI|nr:antigenic cell wall galactomannoprotein [Diplodia corticola]OJD30229.1 antigenic cell wall galactomannoprotein [Diplodia corticola]